MCICTNTFLLLLRSYSAPFVQCSVRFCETHSALPERRASPLEWVGCRASGVGGRVSGVGCRVSGVGRRAAVMVC
jgi:hypothetical protein